jgi:hypothetical protein
LNPAFARASPRVGGASELVERSNRGMMSETLGAYVSPTVAFTRRPRTVARLIALLSSEISSRISVAAIVCSSFILPSEKRSPAALGAGTGTNLNAILTKLPLISS